MAQPTHIFINGVRASQDSLSVVDRGLAYGDGLFETIRVDEHRIPLWEYHCQRLLNGLKRLHIVLSAKQLVNTVDKVLGECAHGVLKLIVTRGQGGRGYTPPTNPEPLLIAVFFPFSESQLQQYQDYQRQGIKALPCQQTLPVCSALAGIKTLSQLPYVLAAREVELAACNEGLMYTEQGLLIEATARNIFIVKEGCVYTPSLNDCGVAGIMRRVIIDHLVVEQSLVCKECELRESDLKQADEVFLSNSISGIWPVVAYGSKRWSVGAVTQAMQQALVEFLNHDTSLAYP